VTSGSAHLQELPFHTARAILPRANCTGHSQPLRGFSGQGSDAPDPHPAGEKASSEIDGSLKDAAQSDDVHKVFSVIEERGETFSESNVTNSFLALAKFADGKAESQVANEIHSSTSFQTLVDMVILGIRRYSTQQLLSIVGACSQMGFDDDMLMDKITARLLKNVEHLDAAQLHDLVTSLAQAESSPSVVFFDALQARVESLGKDVTNDMKTELQDAYSKLGYDRLKDAAKKI